MATFTTEQNRSLRLRLNGEAVDGWQLVALQPRQATVIGPGGNQVLELAVFNGQGGEPPTVPRGAMVCRRQVRSLCRPGRRSAGTAAGCGKPIAVACWQRQRPRLRHPPLPPTTAPAKRRCRPSANASRPVAASCSNNNSSNRRRPRAMAPTDRVNA